MKWSWRIGWLAGIEVRLHMTFVLLLAWVGATHYLERRNWGDVWAGLVFIVAIFAIIVLHELGHALAARRYGIRTRDITLLPIGGVARLERMPEEPKQELLVALAGPAVNVALAAGFALLAPAISVARLPEQLAMVGGSFLLKMLWINVALVVFNMLPAFPMDGGRVLRALLAMRMDYVKATQTAAGIGQAMAFVFGFIGLFANPFLVFIALFVWMGASAEASMVQLKSSLGGIPVRDAMITEFRTVAPGDSLQQVADHVLAGFQQDFPVLADGELVGVLTRGDLMKALASAGGGSPVAAAMRREFQVAEPSEMLEPAFLRLQSCDCHSLPVVRGEHLEGILTMENVGEFMMVQAAIQGKRPPKPWRR